MLILHFDHEAIYLPKPLQLYDEFVLTPPDSTGSSRLLTLKQNQVLEQQLAKQAGQESERLNMMLRGCVYYLKLHRGRLLLPPEIADNASMLKQVWFLMPDGPAQISDADPA